MLSGPIARNQNDLNIPASDNPRILAEDPPKNANKASFEKFIVLSDFSCLLNLQKKGWILGKYIHLRIYVV